jgi:hypothetical protein
MQRTAGGCSPEWGRRDDPTDFTTSTPRTLELCCVHGEGQYEITILLGSRIWRPGRCRVVVLRREDVLRIRRSFCAVTVWIHRRIWHTYRTFKELCFVDDLY